MSKTSSRISSRLITVRSSVAVNGMVVLCDRCVPVRLQRMSQAPSVAASLPPSTQQHLAVEILSKTVPVSHLADQNEVSRKFLYQQKEKATEALEQAFALPSRESEVLFYLPVTHAWLYQLIVSLVLICHSSTGMWWSYCLLSKIR